VYVWLPLVFFSILKTFSSSKKQKRFAILAGIGLAGALHAGDPSFFLPIALISGCALVYYGFFQNKIGWKKSLILVLIIGSVSLGLSAIKLLPVLEFAEVSNKASGGYSFEDSVGSHLSINSFGDLGKIPQMFATLHSRDPHSRNDFSTGNDILPYPFRIGYIAFALMLLSLFKIRNKHVFFSWAILVLFLLIGTGSPFYYLLWKYIPGFSSQHNVSVSEVATQLNT